MSFKDILKETEKVSEQEGEEEKPAYFDKEFNVKLTGEDLFLLKDGDYGDIEVVVQDILRQVGDFRDKKES